MSRFLVFSDLHMNAWKYGAFMDTTGRNSRLLNQVNFFHQLGSYASSYDIKYILFCGDFFHTHSSVKTEVIQAAQDALSMLRDQFHLELVFLVGNHDQANRRGDIHSLGFLENYGHFAKPFTGLKLDDLPMIYGQNYTEEEPMLKSFLDFHKNQDTSSDPPILLMHQGVQGVELGSKGFTLNELLTPDMIPDNILHAFSGHYHSYRRVSDRLTIPGAAMQHTWADAGEPRGFLDVYIEGEDMHIKHIQSRCQNFLSQEWTEDKVNYHVGTFTRITNVPASTDIEDIRQMLKDHGASTVEFEFEEEEKAEAFEKEDFQTTTELFDEYVKAREITGRRLKVGRDIVNRSYRVEGYDETVSFDSF